MIIPKVYPLKMLEQAKTQAMRKVNRLTKRHTVFMNTDAREDEKSWMNAQATVGGKDLPPEFIAAARAAVVDDVEKWLLDS